MRRQLGFTYLTVLFIVAILMTGLALLGEMWETKAKREKEAELLFVGNQYRRAITLFYEKTPGGVKRYPRTLEELLKDPRTPSVQRYLRQLYPDPMGSSEWGIVKSPDGGVAGVYSESEDKPLKTGNFKLRDAGFDNAERYADWKFVYSPTAATVTPASKAAKPGAQPAPPQSTPQPGAGPASIQPPVQQPSLLGPS